MNAQYSVSIVIPIYYMDRYLNDVFNSVLNQIWKNLEVIVISDESTDDISQRIQTCHQVGVVCSADKRYEQENIFGETLPTGMVRCLWLIYSVRW